MHLENFIVKLEKIGKKEHAAQLKADKHLEAAKNIEVATNEILKCTIDKLNGEAKNLTDLAAQLKAVKKLKEAEVRSYC